MKQEVDPQKEQNMLNSCFSSSNLVTGVDYSLGYLNCIY